MSALSFKNFFSLAHTLPNCFLESFFWPSYRNGTETVFLYEFPPKQHLSISLNWYARKSYTRVFVSRVVYHYNQISRVRNQKFVAMFNKQRETAHAKL